MNLPSIFKSDPLFDEFFGSGINFTSWDAEETPESYLISVDMPGVLKKDLVLTLQEGVLSISGERKGRRPTTFRKALRLPRNAAQSENKIKANLENGVLTVEVQKVEASRPKTITID